MMGLGVWKLVGKKFVAWGHGGRYRPFLSATYHIPELGISVAHSFIADAGEQTLPGKFLIDTYLENQPPDIGVLEILCQFFNVQHNAVRRIDNDRQIRF